MDEPVVLVLDDLHLLDSPACLDAIAALVRHVPEGGQVALSTRGDRALPLGTLRARGLAVEIGPDELRLDETEAGQLLRSAGLDLTADEVAELTQHTEGWSAGLYLAALSAKASGAGISGATAFQGDDRFVADYLRSELLLRMPREELLFLTRTAVLERMSGPLCDAVLGESRSGPTLESLARSNDFLVPLDRNGEWYRYHHLFQELLRSELARAEPDLVPLLLARATDWCEVNGQPEAAIGYAEEAGDVEHVARLFEQFAVAAYESGRVATVERWLRWLEMHGALERNAAVAVLGALLAAFWGRPAESERWADAAERASYEGTLPDGSASIDSWRAHLRAQRCHRGLARMRADAELAVRTLSRGAHFGLAPDCCSRSHTGWPASSSRPMTCSPTSPRTASRSGGSTPSRSRWASAPRSRLRVARGWTPRSLLARGSKSSANIGWRSIRPAHSALRWRLASRSTGGTPLAPRSF